MEVYCTIDQNHGLDEVVDNQLIERCRPAIDRGESVRIEMEIQNIDRAFGTMLSHNVSKKWGADGLATTPSISNATDRWDRVSPPG